MEQLRLVDPGTPRRPTRRRAPAARAASDWRLDPRLRRVGRRKVAEARRVLAEARDEPLARAV